MFLNPYTISHLLTLQGQPCDICGDMGVLEALCTCSKCKIGCEHYYCRQSYADDVPDLWLCEVCEGKTSILDPSAMLDQENTHSAGCSKIPKISRGRGRFEWEKTVKTGKVKYMSAHEAIKLSCGAKELSFPAKRNIHSSSKPSRIVPSMPSRTPIRTPIKPQVLSPKSSQCSKANSSVRPEELLPPRPRNTQQQAVQTAKDSKEKKAGLAPRMAYIKGRPIDTHKPAVKKANKESFSSSPVMNFPPLTSSGMRISCGNDYTSVESRSLDVKDGGLVTVLPKAEDCFRGPALDASWTGSFNIIDSVSREEFNEGFRAHPPSIVRRKVYEFSKKMPKVLRFKMLPRDKVWTDIFKGDYPNEDDIGLYFFSSDNQRSANYIVVLELIETRDVVMRSYIDGVELLMFSSKHLSSNFQRWNEKYFLWGVFRHVKKYKAVSKLNEELPRLYRPSHYTKDNDANGDDSLAARKDMTSVDKAILSRETSIRGCGTTMPLHGSDLKTPGVSKKMDSTPVSPNQKGTLRHFSRFS